MRCSACGEENAERRKLCSKCAASLPLVCSLCGVINQPGVRFCEACNEPLEGAKRKAAPADNAAPSSLPRSFVAGRYRVVNLLGEGDSKVVYLAHDLKLHRDVAFALVKVKDLDHAGRARVNREVRALARLDDHPHIVTVYDVGHRRGQPYIVSQYMAGGSLENRLKNSESHRLPALEAVQIAGEVCEALEHAHVRGILHRDLKPANLLFTQDGTCKLADLGFGFVLAAELSRLLGVSMTVGTIAYTAPEQALVQPSDARSDLYSLGALLYEMVTGRPPFLGDNLAAVVDQHINLPPAPPSLPVPGLPRPLEVLILRLLAKSPEDRPKNATEVREELRSVAAWIEASTQAAAAPLAQPAAEPIGGRAIASEARPSESPQLDDSGLSPGPPVEAPGPNLAPAVTYRRAKTAALRFPLSPSVLPRPALVAAACLVALLAGGLAWLGYEQAANRDRIALEGTGRAGRREADGAAPKEIRKRGPGVARERAERGEHRSTAELKRPATEGTGAPGSETAEPKILALAESGDVQAQAKLGNMYLRGQGVAKDYGEALKWLRKAAEQGDTDAKLAVGTMYAKGDGVAQDYVEALQWFSQAASKGNRDAEYAISRMYLTGEGVAQNYGVALEWLRKAASQGSRDAECELGRLYLFGEGVPQDYGEALEWLQKAAAQDSSPAQYELGKLFLAGERVAQDYSVAENWFLRAAAQSNTSAENALGYMYEHGQGVARDYDQALKWYRKGAANDDAKAQLNLGRMYEDGQGVRQNFAEAVRWFRSAAAKGDPVAQCELGFMYRNGRGVSKDDNQALRWFQMAADRGNADAQQALGVMYGNGRGVPQNYATAARWYRKAAAQGNRDAQYNLGYLYEHGDGVTQDYAEATDWYRKAAAQGDAEALSKLRDFVAR
jgi:TPR repeat protein/serine/threonine protein kinase